MPDTLRFGSMAAVRKANAALGHHFFDADTLRFFRSRVGSALYGGRYFVTSEQRQGMGGQLRLYTVRRAEDDGRITTVGEFQAYATRAEALKAISELMAQVSA